ncbi:MAG: SufD family Fe-S cluster assembly protein, partial [Thermoprotei archaeon]
PHDTKLVPLVEALSVKRKAVHSGDGRVEIEVKDGSLVPLNLEVELTDSSQLTLRANSRSGSLSAFLVSVRVPKGVTAKVNVIIDSDSSSLVYARLRIDNEGELNLNLVSSAAKAARIEADVHLMERASSKFLARSIGIEGTVDNVVNVYHEGPESVSDGTLKGAAFGNAQVVVRGLASILEKAYDSSTSIIGRSYVQGSGARTIVVPMLEVKTGRVKMAKHSASAMKVPEDLLFYLQSRGFDRREANAIILRGFMESPDDTDEVTAFIESLLGKVL